MKKNILSLLFLTIILSGCNLASAIRINNLRKSGSLNHRSFREEIPLKRVSNHIIVSVKIEGVLYDFLFDSGADITVFDDDFAKKLHLKTVAKDKVKDVFGHSKKLKYSKINKIILGNTEFKDIGVVVSNLSFLKTQGCIDVVGIMGNNLMSQAIWQINFEGNKIIFTDTKDSLYINKSEKKINFHTNNIGKTPIVRLETDSTFLGELKLDTGSGGGISLSQTTLTSFFSKHKFSKAYGTISGFLSTEIDTAYITELKNISLGSFHKVDFENTPIFFRNKIKGGLIGNKFLQNYIVTIDWLHNELILSPNAITQNDFYTYGFKPSFSNGKLIVDYIFEGSSAHKMGIRLNDEILQINQTDFRNTTLNDYCDYEEPSTETIDIIVKQNGIEKKYELKKTHILDLSN